MGYKLLMGWAVMATALALLLLGILIGRSSGTATVPLRTASGYDAPSTDTSIAAHAQAGEPGYVVPDIFEGLPSEWRTATDADTFDGYAILFDPARREVIVEQCSHRGYLASDGSPLDTNYEFCDGVLWANILVIGEKEVTVRARSGEIVDLDLEMREDRDQRLLSLSFPGHQMALIPGSKNDLFQAMDGTPRMSAEKRKKNQALQAEHMVRVRAQQAAVNETEQDIPTYTLPAQGAERDSD